MWSSEGVDWNTTEGFEHFTFHVYKITFYLRNVYLHSPVTNKFRRDVWVDEVKMGTLLHCVGFLFKANQT